VVDGEGVHALDPGGSRGDTDESDLLEDVVQIGGGVLPNLSTVSQ